MSFGVAEIMQTMRQEQGFNMQLDRINFSANFQSDRKMRAITRFVTEKNPKTSFKQNKQIPYKNKMY